MVDIFGAGTIGINAHLQLISDMFFAGQSTLILSHSCCNLVFSPCILFYFLFALDRFYWKGRVFIQVSQSLLQHQRRYATHTLANIMSFLFGLSSTSVWLPVLRVGIQCNKSVEDSRVGSHPSLLCQDPTYVLALGNEPIYGMIYQAHTSSQGLASLLFWFCLLSNWTFGWVMLHYVS